MKIMVSVWRVPRASGEGVLLWWCRKELDWVPGSPCTTGGIQSATSHLLEFRPGGEGAARDECGGLIVMGLSFGAITYRQDILFILGGNIPQRIRTGRGGEPKKCWAAHMHVILLDSIPSGASPSKFILSFCRVLGGIFVVTDEEGK